MRWFARILVVVILIFAVGVPVAWLTRNEWVPAATKWGVNAWAAGNGAEQPVISEIRFRIDSLSPDRLTLSDIGVNGPDGIEADRLLVGFDWRDLLQGHIRAVAVDRPRLTVTVTEDGGITLGGLEPLRALSGGADGSDAGRAMPVVRFSDIEIVLEGAARGRLVASGTLGETDGGLGLAADGSGVVEAADWRADGAGRLQATHGDARTRVNVTLTEAKIRRGDLSAEGLRGTASIDLPAEAGPEAIVDLRADRAQAAGVAVAVPSAHLRLDPLGLSAVFRLGDRGDPDLRLAVTADEAEGERRPVAAALSADLATLDRLVAAARRTPPHGIDGRVYGTLRGSMPAVLDDAERIWNGTVAAGGLDLSADSPGGSAQARLGAAIAAGTLALETLEPARIDLAAEALPPEVVAILGDGSARATLGRADKAFRMALRDPFDAPAFSVGGPARVETTRGAEATFDGEAVLSAGPSGPRVTAASGTLDVTGLTVGDARLDSARLVLDRLSGDPSSLSGAGLLTARLDAAGVEGATVSLPLRLAHDDNGTALFLVRDGAATVPRVPAIGDVSVSGPLAVRLLAARRPVLRQGFGDEAGAVRLELPIAIHDTAATLRGGMPLGVSLAPARGTLKARMLDGRGGAVVRITTDRVEVSPAEDDPAAPDGIALAAVALEAVATTHGDGVAFDRVALTADRMTDRARSPRFAPLRVEGEAVRVASGALEFTSTFRGADGAFVLDAEGFHDVSKGQGRAYVTLFPLVFVPGGLQPVDLSPAAAATLRNASGRVSLKGAVEWPGTGVPPDEPLTLTVEDLAFTGSLGTVSGLSGAVGLSSVDPLATLAHQTLSATGIDVGVPIAEPQVAFRVDPDLTLVLESVRARFAGGDVHTRDVSVPLRSGEPISMILAVDGVDAARLAEVTDLDGLTASGALTGRLPLVWDFDKGLSLRRARLSATTPGGTVRYRPDNPPPALQDSGEEVSLLMQAVRNLVYERFEIEADGRPGEPFDIKLRVRGANPDLFDGYPVALNVSLSGRLDEMFLNARRTLGLSDVLQRKLQARGAGG